MAAVFLNVAVDSSAATVEDADVPSIAGGDESTPPPFWCARAAMLMGDTSAPADEPPPPLPPLPWDVATS